MNDLLALDFVEQPTWSVSRLSPWSMVVFLTGLLIAVCMLQYYLQLDSDYQAVVVDTKQTEVPVVHEEIRPLSASELKTVRQTVADLSTPWGQLLSGLEAVKMQQVALLLLEPNIKKQQVELTGQAKDIQSLLRYVESVSALPMLTNVYLKNHMIELNDPDRAVNFTVIANWQVVNE